MNTPGKRLPAPTIHERLNDEMHSISDSADRIDQITDSKFALSHAELTSIRVEARKILDSADAYEKLLSAKVGK